MASAKINDPYQSKICDILHKALKLQKEKNPRLSQRALAKKMGLNSSYLSKIIRGERKLSRSLLTKIIRAFQLDDLQVSALQKLLMKQIEASELAAHTGIYSGEEAASTLEQFSSLGSKHYWLLEDWYYLPLLNIFTISSRRNNSAWLSRRLGLTEDRVKLAMERLLAEKYLVTGADGKIRRSELKLRFPTVQSHPSIRKYHEQTMKKALGELRKTDNLSFHDRLISGISFAGNPKKIKEAKLILEKALYQAAEIMATDEAEEVFQLNVQFFKITK